MDKDIITIEKLVKKLVERYTPKAKLSTFNDRLVPMLEKMEENASEWPVDKTNRWLGFVQGCLFVEELIDVDVERDFTRPLFHKYYEDNGIKIPESVDVTK